MADDKQAFLTTDDTRKDYLTSYPTQDNVFMLSAEKKEEIIESIDKDVTFVFSTLKTHRVQLSSQITDYWLEDNTAIQDTIAHQPLIITLTGLVSEVVFTPPRVAMSWLKVHDKYNLTGKLSTLGSIIPTVDNYTQLAKNAISYAESAFMDYYKKYQNLIKNAFNSANVTNQQHAFATLWEYWQNNTPLIVSTPYVNFGDMYIQNVDISQDDTTTQSILTVTLKQLTFKSVEYTKADPKKVAEITQAAQAVEQNNGNVQGKKQSWGVQLLNKINPNFLKNKRYRPPGG